MNPPAFTRRALLAGAALPLLGCREEPAVLQGGFSGKPHERGHLLRAARDWPAPAVLHRTRVVIAGGGVAGLAAARALRQRRVDDFALLELEDSAGGNSRGTRIAGIDCPLGAHYLPVPGDSAVEVQAFLEEIGLRRRVAGRWTYDERHLCHSPQERLFFQGSWQDGLLPVQDVPPATLEQYRRFANLVAAAQKAAPFTIPRSKGPIPRVLRSLSAINFVAWLDHNGLSDPHLRWYLDYCCRDDYGAGIGTVSAWAGLHYFASRHGFSAPGDGGEERGGVLTWPEGNSRLSRTLAEPLGERLRTGHVVLRIAQVRQGVEVDAWNTATEQVERWQAARCIVALPVFVAARVIESPPAFLQQAAARMRYAPWVVVNLHVGEPLAERPGAAPSWDNVVYGAAGLGYVDARHQTLQPVPGPTVLTWYCAPGEAARGALLSQPWQHWCGQALAELSQPHPDLRAKLSRAEVMRYGHAMAIPVPADTPLALPPGLRAGGLGFAHADWAGYSIFEEAFTAGHLAGLLAA